MKKLLLLLFAIFLTVQGWTQVVKIDIEKQLEIIYPGIAPPGGSGDTIILCDSISVIPWSDSFDTYGTGTKIFPTCWTKNSNQTDRPYVHTTNFSSPGSLFFYATYGKYNIAALPRIAQYIHVNTLRLNFKFRNTYYSDTLKVGVMTDPNDTSTWTQVGFVSAPTTATWYDAEVSFARYQGTGKYIAFRIADHPSTTAAYIDDLVVSYIPACSKPTNLTISNITTYSADVTWIPGKPLDFAWWIYYKKTGTSDWDSIYSTVNSYSFNNLNASSSYDIEIKTDCGNELSEPSLPIFFRTACGEISNFPWIENFDNYAGLGISYYPACWNKKTTQSSYPYLNGVNYSSPAALFFYAAFGNYNIAILPAIHSSSLVKSLSLNFKLRKTAVAYNMIIGVMTDTTDVTTFDTVSIISPSAINTWETFDIDLSNYTSLGKYIAFKLHGVPASKAAPDVPKGMYLDNLSVYVTPSCAMPFGLINIDSMTTPNSITLDWDGSDDNNVLSWIIEYKQASDNVWQSEVAFNHPFTLSNLLQSTVYQFRLSAICSSGDTTLPSNSINVGTQCAAITSFPWIEGFEEDWHPASGVSSAEHPWCWTNINGGASTSYKWQKTTSTTYVYNGNGALQMYATDKKESFSDWFITPVVTLTGNERLQFWAKGYSISFTEELNIQILDVSNNGIIDKESDTSLFTVIMPNTIIPSENWNQYEINLSQFIGDYQIAFVRNTSMGFYLNIDDISISSMPQCASPTLITFNNLTYNSVDISWTPGTSTDNAWWVYYKQIGSLVWDSVYATNNPITINNLNPDTEYEVEIRTACGSQLSLPSILTNFITPCSPITTIPYIENFDTYGGTGSAYYPDCWTKTTTYLTYPALNGTNHSPPASLYFYASSGSYNLAILHEIDASIPLDSLMVSFWVRNGNLTSNVIVGIMDSINDPDSFTPIETISPSDRNTWEKFEVYFKPYTGTGRNITFKSEYNITNNYFYLDDVVIDYIPACPTPINLNAYNITTSSADISWQGGNQAYSSWWLYYKESSATNFDSLYISNLTTYTINNLTASTEYTYYLITDCGSEYSKSSIVKTFRTPCVPITVLPYTENFDNLGGYGESYFPFCWNKISLTTFPYLNTANYSPPYALYFNTSSTGTYDIAILEELDTSFPANSLMVSFWMRKGNLTSNCIVGIMDSPNDSTSFTPIDTIAPSATVVWENFEVYLNSYAGSGRYIAFKSEYNTTTNYFYLDDVVVDYMPRCPKPLRLNIANIATSSVDISWMSSNVNTNSWWLYWKENSASTYDSVLVNNVTTYTLNNLNHSTGYEYYMKTNCGSEISNSTSISSFFTVCSIVTSFPWKEGFEDDWILGTGISNDDAPNQCWININGGSTSYKWRKNTNPSVPSYVRTGTGAALLYGVNQSMGDYLMTPIMTLTGNEQLIFWGKGYSSTNRYPENLWIKAYDVSANGDISSFSDTTLFTNIIFINDTNQYTWKEYEIPLSNLFGNYRLVFARDNNVGYNYQIDDLMVDKIPPCPRPISVSASNITQNTANITWIPGDTIDSSWKIYYRPTGSQTWDSIITVNNPHILTNLLHSTIYEIGVATDCGFGAFSNMRTTTFRTGCGAITSIPWTDNFDSYGTGTTVFPNCWTRNTTQSLRPYVNTGGYSLPGCLYFQASSVKTYNIAAIPPIDKKFNISTLKITFKYKSQYATDVLLVGIMTDPSKDSTFVPISRITTPTTNNWYDDTVYFSSYTGNGQYIAFRIDYQGSTTIARIDDVEVSYNIVCDAPTNIVANNITINSANISWIAGGTETSWQIKQGESGSIIDLINSTYQAIGLSPNTNYTYYLRSNCGNNLYSSWVSLDFTTQDLPKDPIVETSNITVFTHNTARFTGSYTQGRDAVIGIGFKYKEQSSSNWINESITPVATPFNFDASGLTPNTSYKVIAYATTSAGTFYGDTATFTTNQLLPPNVTTDTVIVDNTDKSAKFEGTTSQGTYAIIARGFEYKISSADWSAAIDLTATGSANITATATSLKVDKYNVRAYAETLEGKTYGGILDFEIVSSLNSIEGNSLEVNLYPNPASNEATLSIKGVNGKTKITITDVQGRTINTFDKEGINGEIKYSLDLSNYAKGVYYIRIQNSNSIKTQKLIVQ